MNSTHVNTSSNSRSAYDWKDIIPWATALDFNIILVGTSNSDGSTIVNQISKSVTNNFVDHLDGSYTIKYRLTSGSSYKMFISYTLNEITTSIPGSPFTITVSPSNVAPLRSISSGTGLLTPVQEHTTSFLIALKDLYSNPISASSDYVSYLSFSINGDSSLCTFTTSVLSVGNSKNPYSYAVFSVEYMTPKLGSYLLSVKYNNTDLRSSPYSVSAYESVEVSSSVEVVAFALCVLCIVIAVACFALMIIFYSHPVIRAAAQNMMFTVIGGAVVVVIGVWIRVYVSDLDTARCTVSPWLIGIGFVLCCSAIFFKSYRISKIFTSKSLKTVKIVDSDLILPLLGIILLESILQVARYFVDPATVRTVPLSSNALLTYQTCKSEGFLFPALLYGYKAIMLGYGVYLGVISRNAPALFNESSILSYIIFTITFMSVVILPLSFAIESPTVTYSLEVMGILFGVMSTLLVLFLPKSFYIYEQPNQGSVRGSVMVKSTQSKSAMSVSSLSENKSSEQMEEYKSIFLLSIFFNFRFDYFSSK